MQEGINTASKDLSSLVTDRTQLVNDIALIPQPSAGDEMIYSRMERILASNPGLALTLKQMIQRTGTNAVKAVVDQLVEVRKEVDSLEDRRANTDLKLSKLMSRSIEDGTTIHKLREEVVEALKTRETVQSENERLKKSVIEKETEVNVLKRVQEGLQENVTVLQLEEVKNAHSSTVKLLERQLLEERERNNKQAEQVKHEKEKMERERIELVQEHRKQLDKETKAAASARAQVETVRRGMQQKLDTEIRARMHGDEVQIENLVHSAALMNQVSEAQQAANLEAIKVQQLHIELGSTNAELSKVQAHLTNAERERDAARAAMEQLKASTMQSTSATEEEVARLQRQMKEREDAIERQKVNIKDLQAKRDELTRSSKKAGDEATTWRSIILLDVLKLENWRDLPMREQELCRLLNNNHWPALDRLQDQVWIMLGHNPEDYPDVALLALSIWGRASMTNPTLGPADIDQFATALLGAGYQTRILAFLEIAIGQMIGKALTVPQALFCLHGLELLCRCCSDAGSRSRLADVFGHRRIDEIPNFILVRGAERFVDRRTNGFDDSRGATIKWAIEKYSFPYYPLVDEFFLLMVKGPNNKNQVLLVGDGDNIVQVPFHDLQCQADMAAGTYTVSIANIMDMTPKTCNLDDCFGDLFDIFPGLQVTFD